MPSAAEASADSTVDWLRGQLAGRLDEEIVAGAVFRPRGAWGDSSRRLRRFLWRRVGVGDGFHELERRMGLLNVAVATRSELTLFGLHGGMRSVEVEDRIAAWPLARLRFVHKRHTVKAAHSVAAGGDTFSSSTYQTKIVTLRLEPADEQPLEIDLAAGRPADRLLKVMRGEADVAPTCTSRRTDRRSR